ncbi:MAG TPA: hypothetical protein VGQ86_10595 [Candidatus Limnocylindria bacterium]|nr:hypothetical protein [Candidatus Limnocylindria bacterium]
MNAFAQQILVVAKGYLGPAAQTFLATEFRALGVNANSISPAQLEMLVDNVRVKAARAMGEDRAAELASKLAALGARAPKPADGGHRLASDAAAKLLSSGRARHAETAYRELVEKHGDPDSYRGLARAQAALQNDAAALTTLRDGATKFAQQGDRAASVSLLAEAVAIAPSDLAAHRRLAAALANQGDLQSAIEEYERFVDVALEQRDTRRAWLELAYGRETLGDLPGLLRIVDRVAAASGGAAGPAPRPTQTPAPIQASRLASQNPNPSAPTPAAHPTVSRAQTPPATPAAPPVQAAPLIKAAPSATPVPVASAKGTPLGDRLHSSDGKTRPESQTTVVLKGAKTFTHAEQGDVASSVDLLARAGLSTNGHRNGAPVQPARPQRPPIDIERELSTLVPTGSGMEAASVAASRATLLIGMRDKRATEAAIDAARRLLSLGKLQSASDLLLDYIAHGFADREAQRLLIEVDCAIGRRDTAKEKCALLSYAYRLDGRAEVADDVERLARIL